MKPFPSPEPAKSTMKKDLLVGILIALAICGCVAGFRFACIAGHPCDQAHLGDQRVGDYDNLYECRALKGNGYGWVKLYPAARERP